MSKRVVPIFLFNIVAFLSLCVLPAWSITDRVSVKDFGAVGDGKTDDTAAVQAAVDALGKAGGTVEFPLGTYVIGMVNIREGLILQGHGAVIKKKDNAGKWSRTFTTQAPDYRYSGDELSRPLVIRGLTFDGNRLAQGPYTKYELEQAHMIFLNADSSKPGRLQAIVEDCFFHDCVADAVSVYSNVSLKMSNCTAVNVFRGALVVTGGYSDIQVNNLSAGGDVHVTGIDVEVDSAGYNRSFKVDLQLNNLDLAGDFDIAIRDGSTVTGNNIRSSGSPFNLYAVDSSVRISNSTFGVGMYSGQGNRIIYPQDVTFSNCTFYAVRGDKDTGNKFAPLHIYWNIGKEARGGQRLKLQGCDFKIGKGIKADDVTYAVYAEADNVERDNRIIMRDCSIEAGYKYGVWLNLGGNLSLSNVDMEADTALYLGSTTGYFFNVLVDDISLGKGVKTYASIPYSGPENTVTHRGVELDAGCNVLASNTGLAKNTYRGGRIIRGSMPPEKTPGLLGDICRLNNPVAGQTYEWICTASSHSAAVWKPLMAAGQ